MQWTRIKTRAGNRYAWALARSESVEIADCLVCYYFNGYCNDYLVLPEYYTIDNMIDLVEDFEEC